MPEPFWRTGLECVSDHWSALHGDYSTQDVDPTGAQPPIINVCGYIYYCFFFFFKTWPRLDPGCGLVTLCLAMYTRMVHKFFMDCLMQVKLQGLMVMIIKNKMPRKTLYAQGKHCRHHHLTTETLPSPPSDNRVAFLKPSVFIKDLNGL